MSGALNDDVDLFAPLELELRYAEAAADDFAASFRGLMRIKGRKAADSYVMGMLIAAVAGCRAAFDDTTVKRVLDMQMAIEMPAEPSDSERRH